jgi:hypothetical protein
MKEKNEKEVPGKPQTENSFPFGFSKGVNDFYNHLVTVADAKAAAILAANFVLLGGLININFCHCIFIPFILTGLTAVISIIFCCVVLYPRLPKSEKGLIFWENVNCYEQDSDYIQDINNLSKNAVEDDYARQNWRVSKVLSTKNKNIRYSVITFCISLVLLVITFFIKNL